MNKPLRIGITGGIGSGKTVISQIFNMLGAPVYNADIRARELMTENSELKQSITALLGEEAFRDNRLNASYISGRVFADEKLLSSLNSLVHPRVGKDFEEWTKQRGKEPSYLLKEAALMFESGSYKLLDKVITVFAPAELRINRVLERDPHRSRKDVSLIISRQMDEEEKLKKADYIVYNDEEHLVIPQVLKLHEAFLLRKI